MTTLLQLRTNAEPTIPRIRLRNGGVEVDVAVKVRLSVRFLAPRPNESRHPPR